MTETEALFNHAQERHWRARRQLEGAENEMRVLGLGLVGEQIESKIKELEETRRLIDTIPRPMSLDVTKLINDSERDVRNTIDNLKRIKKRFDEAGITAYIKGDIPGEGSDQRRR